MSFKVFGIGEILWDLLPNGKQLGGAPANFAYHARALGAHARVVSRIGEDDLGREVLERLDALGLPTDTIEIDRSAPTGTVTVEFDPSGQPRYIIHEMVAWDNLAGEGAARRAVSSADAVCFGTLGQRSPRARSSIRSLVQGTPQTSLRILDVNLRQNYYSAALIRESLELANLLKVNEAELPLIAELLALKGNEREQIARLAAQFGLLAIALTRGDRGSLLLHQGRWSDHPGIPAQVVDTIGAGDAFTAAMTLGILKRWDLDTINQSANEVAAFVASRAGATPELPEKLRARFSVGN